MVCVDAACCAYCGGCVSVCPVEALTLVETHLIVKESCTECGACVTACPMGALYLEAEHEAAVPMPGHRAYDLVVVGAGPAGSVAAACVAQAGLRVLLIEKRQEIGSPVRCAEGVGHEQLVQFIEPDPRWIAAEIHQAEITTVAADVTHTVHATGGRGYVLERRIFDRVLAERAARAGAEVCVKTAVTGLLLDEGRVCGVRIGRVGAGGEGSQVEVAAQVVIAADGVEAQVGRWAGLDMRLPLADTMVCAQYLLAGVSVDPTCTYYTIGNNIAPGGYAWVFPKGEGKANVGLGVQADLRQDASGILSKGPAMSVLDVLIRFIESRRELAQGQPVSLIAGNVPVALPPAQFVTDGLMMVGDAARQVAPLTGGGIINAMSAGRLAATVAAAAIAAGDPSARMLSRYQDAWQETVGRKMQRNYRLRSLVPTRPTHR